MGGVEKLLNWDIGLGIDHPDFQDVYLPTEAMDPVDFNMVDTLSDQLKDLGLRQVGAPEVINLDIALNVDVLQEGVNVKEDFFYGGAVYHGSFPTATVDEMEDID